MARRRREYLTGALFRRVVENAHFWAECYVGRYGAKSGPLSVCVRFGQLSVFSRGGIDRLTGDLLCEVLLTCAALPGKLPAASKLKRGNGE